MATSRVSITRSFTDVTSGDQEQDANIALTEQDKGLRSQKLGVQCEAVFRFPRVVSKYPFSIIINSAFLRLADMFRGGNNLLRWCIVRVTQQSEKHLEKILNVDEFVKKIYTVIHSNDPVARALTLRALGSIANIIYEKKNVHHSIVNGLDSHDAMEMDAAVFAAEKFSAKSKVFAANICSKIAEMIEEIATPVDLKLRLIPIMQNMYHDHGTASKACRYVERYFSLFFLAFIPLFLSVLQCMYRSTDFSLFFFIEQIMTRLDEFKMASSVCTELLTCFPSQKFVTLTLHTMTQLAVKSLIQIQQQIELLIHYMNNDPRKAVKMVALQNMNVLAKKAPHQWQYHSVEKILDFALSSRTCSLKTAALQVLTTLSASVTFQLFMIKDVTDMQKILEVCSICYQSQNPSLSSKAIEFYTNVVISHKTSKIFKLEMGQEIVDGARLAAVTQICLSAWSSDKTEQVALKHCLRCAVRLVKAFPDTGHYFVAEIVQLLAIAQEDNGTLLCECLAAIGSGNSCYIEQVIPELLALYQKYVSHSHQNIEICMYLGTLLFQAARGEVVPSHIQQLVLQCTSNFHNPWFAYKLGRQAMRYGQYPIATEIFHSLSQQVASEHFHFWLLALNGICAAESISLTVGKDIISLMSKATESLNLYQKGLASLKASATPTFSMKFHCDYVRLRISVLQAHTQLVQTCNTFRTCPPPAIATAVAMTNGQEISRCGQILSQLGKCVKEYESLSENFADLYQSSFDADPNTLHEILLLQQSCEVMKSSILKVIKSSHARYLQFGGLAADHPLSITIQKIQGHLNSLIQSNYGDALTHQHMDFLCQSVQLLFETPFTFPRYFFQTLQSTELKLEVSPRQNNSLDPVLVHHETHLTIKIEGVIQHGARRELYRKASKVCISVNTDLVSKAQPTTDTKTTVPVSNALSECVEPHNDYFLVNFLLAFPVTGLHNVTIRADIIDESENHWKTGPVQSLTVKSYDDTVQKKTTQKPVRTSFGQMPPQSQA